jgi:predicted component of type VI protein secretion system
MFIYDIRGNLQEQQAGEAIALLPENRTLLIEQLTGDPPPKPEIVTGLKTIDDVFNRYQPKVEVEFEGAEGESMDEEISFNGLGDFGPKGLIKNSDFLQDLDAQVSNYHRFMKYLNNKILRKMLADPEAKAAYLAELDNMLAELEAADE